MFRLFIQFSLCRKKQYFIWCVLFSAPLLASDAFAKETFDTVCPGVVNTIPDDMRVPPDFFSEQEVLKIARVMKKNPESASVVDNEVLGPRGKQWAWLIQGYVLRSELRITEAKAAGNSAAGEKKELLSQLKRSRDSFCTFLVEEGSYRD